MLSIENLVSGYNRLIVLHGVSLTVAAGEIVALVGANGAGKSTLLRAISGIQPIKSGRIEFDGEAIERKPPHQRVGAGIAQVPEGRQVFAPLTVEDNLLLGAWTGKAANTAAELEKAYDMFPVLRSKRALLAGSMSGGEQQMLAIARALMCKPKLVLLDEPSMGLAPKLVDQVLDVISSLRGRGLTLLLVEQNAHAALSIADRAYVLETGTITMSGSGEDLLDDARIREAYLGV